jgi:hypothetical protein
MTKLFTNSLDVIANRLSVIDGNNVVDIKELLLPNLNSMTNIIGLPIETPSALQTLAERKQYSKLYYSIVDQLTKKATVIDVNHAITIIIPEFLNYGTTLIIDKTLSLKDSIK